MDSSFSEVISGDVLADKDTTLSSLHTSLRHPRISAGNRPAATETCTRDGQGSSVTIFTGATRPQHTPPYGGPFGRGHRFSGECGRCIRTGSIRADRSPCDSRICTDTSLTSTTREHVGDFEKLQPVLPFCQPRCRLAYNEERPLQRNRKSK